MTNEEIIRSIIDELKDGYIACGEQGYKLLRASLEKQIPKKPTWKKIKCINALLATTILCSSIRDTQIS